MTNYEKLFGTPERAAETLKRMCACMAICNNCPFFGYSVDFCECIGDGVTEWLESEEEMTDNANDKELVTIIEALTALASAITWTMPNSTPSVESHLKNAWAAIDKLKEELT